MVRYGSEIDRRGKYKMEALHDFAADRAIENAKQRGFGTCDLIGGVVDNNTHLVLDRIVLGRETVFASGSVRDYKIDYACDAAELARCGSEPGYVPSVKCIVNFGGQVE
ncbi:hypothetical protein J4216_00005, partial [Candidatus Woesearchaeota archaeon]|nr:hypothetical protein [Candidatus Woesearchaeota archaeon]